MNRQPADIRPGDDALVEQAQRGRPQAFAELVARYQDRVYNVCYRLCGQEADALDLTQSTFLKALEALPQFEARSTFYTWLFRIAVNLAFSQRRRERRRRTVSLSEAVDDGERRSEPAAPAETYDAAHDADTQEQYARATAALARLAPEFRAAVVLRDIEDLDYAAIAEILGVPPGTVKSRIYRGRTMLHEMLSTEKAQLGNQPT
ncbi:MAG: sigma-70 family RNA polymerase sigma factor [Phycisphaerae bacterium]